MESMDGSRVNIEVITSFDKKYYEKIGHACVKSWLDNWPTNLTLTCYVEGFALAANPRLNQIPFVALGQDYIAFQASDEKDRVKTFAKKAYSVIHAMENSTADRIVWLDADVITQDTITTEFLELLCPNDTLATFMGVKHEAWFSAETGIFVLNTHHPEFKAFAARYKEYYTTHKKDNIRRFYDGEVFGAVAKEFESRAKLNDLCADFKKEYKTPLKHTILGPYLHHHKSKHAKDDFVRQAQ